MESTRTVVTCSLSWRKAFTHEQVTFWKEVVDRPACGHYPVMVVTLCLEGKISQPYPVPPVACII